MSDERTEIARLRESNAEMLTALRLALPALENANKPTDPFLVVAYAICAMVIVIGVIFTVISLAGDLWVWLFS